MSSNRRIKPPQFFIITSLFLLQFVASIRASESCPNHCVCSSLQDTLSSAQCKRFPQLDQLADDLHVLQIESAEICPISRNLQRFAQLNTLSVSNCAIDVNADSFKNLGNLQTVVLHNTSTINVDPSLFEFNRNLKNVNLSSNPLKIWRHFLISASIEEVDLTRCGLKEIPKKAFSQILNLKRLILKDNGLKTSNYVLPNSLNFLDLSNNEFENISLRVFRPLANLKEIDLSGNPLICSCKLKLIEEYLRFKNVSFTKPIECVNENTNEFVALDEISLKTVCKLRDNLNEKAFVAKLVKRLRRSVDWSEEYIEKSRSFADETEIIDSLDEKVANSSEITNVLEAKMKYIDSDDDSGDDDSEDNSDGKKENKKSKKDEDEDNDNSAQPDDDEDGGEDGDKDKGSGWDADDDGDDDSIMGLNGVLMIIAATIMLLVILVIGIIVALVLKFLGQMNDDINDNMEEVIPNDCEGSSSADHGECRIPMVSRRSSTRKGTACRICPSTMSSRRSDRTCYCNRGTYSDTDTVVNDCQFDSNPTSACTTFERSSRC